MMPHRKNSLAAQRFAGRRERENEAPKLSAQVPALASLRFDIEEQSGAGATRYVRRFMVDSAPALFLVPCGDPRCQGEEHDLTMTVMRALRARETSFQGTDDCGGSIGTSPCLRVVRFDSTAEYRAGVESAGLQERALLMTTVYVLLAGWLVVVAGASRWLWMHRGFRARYLALAEAERAGDG